MGRNAVASDERSEAVVVIERPVLLHVDDDVFDRDLAWSARLRTGGDFRSADPGRCQARDSDRAGHLEQPATTDGLTENSLVHSALPNPRNARGSHCLPRGPVNPALWSWRTNGHASALCERHLTGR